MKLILKAKNLKRFTMRATDGDIGSIDDFYFDDESFVVRYFIGDTRTWFFGGKVLLSPEAFTDVHIADESISVNATKEQIKDSPKPDEKEPISRQYERELGQYYGWGAAPLTQPRRSLFGEEAVEPHERAAVDLETREESHLQSVNDVRNYRVHAINGEVGRVSDFLLESDTWNIRYLEVDVGGFLSKELVLVSTDWISEINWRDRTITVNVDKERIEAAPDYFEETPLTREDEMRLYRHYDQPPYWEARRPY
ncbi:PRC-barrel domain-containing protein [Halalkalibacter oceani]|uniref:PRC-barrel domain-containing protein n=1 Tax=Halalkalibacter oceani TaxID=1653776 RepID=A0A9X2DND7_9BACI|nr:PRC-barrel domain-containing protein [Halalkalibacter oceani]MCM3713909.1 PRC-barrel domain-containing protein [Halalkalibacter oceani]